MPHARMSRVKQRLPTDGAPQLADVVASMHTCAIAVQSTLICMPGPPLPPSLVLTQVTRVFPLHAVNPAGEHVAGVLESHAAIDRASIDTPEIHTLFMWFLVVE